MLGKLVKEIYYRQHIGNFIDALCKHDALVMSNVDLKIVNFVLQLLIHNDRIYKVP
jgi:hypothetical protein